MKKLYYLSLLVAPMLFAASCDDDNNLPDVDVSVEISGGERVDGAIYVVAGDILSIDAINVVNREEGKSAIITEAAYSWDYGPALFSVVPPYGASFVTNENMVGRHLLQIQCPLLAEDKSAAMMHMSYNVMVVSDEEGIPSGPAETVLVDRPGIKEN